ncbi:hypothetical protein P6144_03675 [Sphingomonas sp. HITSZ_GF]|uniref:hypothetical protein n=1 Tax=Sphingomonas sp. HITSZ_GF TaxID=3037247 RepID=UPI00240E3D7D|nr:hypothetical protein [Sphingomonas sp. HITSZ_GF]MDG2532734.1 hypothetical protein [Sphingomonas sp. HITSZ_GF]
MRLIIPALFALTAPLPALAQGTPPAHCAVGVQFGSYAMGIDRPALERVRTLLGRDRGVLTVEMRRWGREGEMTLCVQLRDPRDARRVFARVKSVLPARPRGPITVETREGLRFETPRPR